MVQDDIKLLWSSPQSSSLPRSRASANSIRMTSPLHRLKFLLRAVLVLLKSTVKGISIIARWIWATLLPFFRNNNKFLGKDPCTGQPDGATSHPPLASTILDVPAASLPPPILATQSSSTSSSRLKVTVARAVSKLPCGKGGDVNQSGVLAHQDNPSQDAVNRPPLLEVKHIFLCTCRFLI